MGSTGHVVGSVGGLAIVNVAKDCNGAAAGFVLAHVLSRGFGAIYAPRDFGAPVNIAHAVHSSLGPRARVFIYRVNTGRINGVGRSYIVTGPRRNVVASIKPRRLRAFGSVRGICGAGFRLRRFIDQGNNVLFTYNSDGRVVHRLSHSYGLCNADGSLGCCTSGVDCNGFNSAFAVRVNSMSFSLGAGLLKLRDVISVVNTISLSCRLNMSISSVGCTITSLGPTRRQLRVGPFGGNSLLVSSTCGSGPRNYLRTMEMLNSFSNVGGIIMAPNLVRLNRGRCRYGCGLNLRTAGGTSVVVLINLGHSGPVTSTIGAASFPRRGVCVITSFGRTVRVCGGFTSDGAIILFRGSLPSGCLG